MKVYGSKRWRSFRVIWCLEELGLDYEIADVFPRSDEIRAVNPLGQVPALEVDGEVLTDSLAILHFLADRAGRLTRPVATPGRAAMDARINFVLTEMEAPLWLAARHSYVHPQERRHPEIKPWLREDFAEAERKFATLLGDGPWLCGAEFTIADIVAGHVADWAQAARFEIATEALEDYRARIRERPAYRRAQSG